MTIDIEYSRFSLLTFHKVSLQYVINCFWIVHSRTYTRVWFSEIKKNCLLIFVCLLRFMLKDIGIAVITMIFVILQIDPHLV